MWVAIVCDVRVLGSDCTSARGRSLIINGRDVSSWCVLESSCDVSSSKVLESIKDGSCCVMLCFRFTWKSKKK